MDAFDYVASLSKESLEILYQDKWTCQAIFQSLSIYSKQIVVRLLFSAPGEAFSAAFVASWFKDQTFVKYIDRLVLLRMVVQRENRQYVMNAVFQRHMKLALASNTGAPWLHGSLRLEKENKNAPIAGDVLEGYARSRWNSVLHYMVGSDAVAEPPASVVDILLRTKLMQPTGDKSALHITNTGYEFMLMDVHVQMWIFMMEYINTIDKSGQLRKEDILKFLFQLSYCQTNEYYAISDLSTTQQALLKDFIDFGLLYRRKAASKRFYTTSLAVKLIFGGQRNTLSMASNTTFEALKAGPKANAVAQPITTDTGSKLSIVVETNFKIYAYTSSTLHVAMLSVFLDVVTKLPNMAVGFITRESVRSALVNGITSQHIYNFLLKHADPRTLNRQPIIPENVADQLYLWECERNRLTFHQVIVFDGFSTKQDFEQVVAFAKSLHCLCWLDNVHYKLATKLSLEKQMKHYIKTKLSQS